MSITIGILVVAIGACAAIFSLVTLAMVGTGAQDVQIVALFCGTTSIGCGTIALAIVKSK